MGLTMTEYIKREAVQKMLENAQIISDGYGEYCGYCTEDVDISAIPAADVVEVVRCGQCMYDGLTTCPLCYIEKHTLRFINHDENFYCAYGERRAE